MSVFATAIPSHLYEAMSEDMLSNGLLSRMMVIEGKSIKRHIDESDNPYLASSVPKDKPVYENIINEAMFWKELKPGGGVLNALFPRPNIVNHTVSGANLAFKYTNEYNDKYNDVIISNKNVEASVWGRAGENMNKIALIAACSRHMNTRKLEITEEDVEVGHRICSHQASLLLDRAERYVFRSEFDQKSKKVLHVLESEGCRMNRSKLIRKMRMSAKEFNDMINTLEEMELVFRENESTSGRPAEYIVRRERT
jgi:hypothetical protein